MMGMEISLAIFRIQHPTSKVITAIFIDISQLKTKIINYQLSFLYICIMIKIAAIHDISCFGRASLTVAIPILSYMGFQVCPLPTAVLSSHSEYPNFRSIDLTDFMPEVINHWKELNVNFEAIYSGYLGSEKQVNIVSEFFDYFKSENNFIIVDPVLGDNGKLYPGMPKEMISAMKKLCRKANIITPNLTEAALILGKTLEDNTSLEEVIEWAKELSNMGPQNVIITSAPTKNKNNIATISYNAKEDTCYMVEGEHINASYPGTGDAFASAVTACILKGERLEVAISKAVSFIQKAIMYTKLETDNTIDGIQQERFMHILTDKSYDNNYKKL